MVGFTVITRDGASHAIEAEAGLTVMEAIRQANLGELEALCGGSCSCATCHVFIDSAHLTKMCQDEDDLLDSSDHRCAISRLSCQLKVEASLEGHTVTIAPED